MASHISKFSHFFAILVLVASVVNMGLLVQVSGSGTCSQQGLGMCSPFNDECDKKCKALHSDGQGSCDSQFNLCTCSYNCPALLLLHHLNPNIALLGLGFALMSAVRIVAKQNVLVDTIRV